MDELTGDRWELVFRADKSMRYHQRRRAFFDRCHRWVMFLVIVSGSAAFAGLLPATYTAVAGALLAALDLTLGFGVKARDHQLLYQRFADLNRRLRRLDAADAAALAAARDDMLAIEADEPPVLVALEVDCHNETARAWGTASREMPELSWWQRLTMHLLSHEKAQFRLRKAETAA